MAISIQDDRNAQKDGKTPMQITGSAVKFDRKATNQRWDRLRIEGWKWRPAWREIRDEIAPTRGMFEYENPNWGKRIDHERIINSHAMDALDTMAAGMASGMTTPMRSWLSRICTRPGTTCMPKSEGLGPAPRSFSRIIRALSAAATLRSENTSLVTGRTIESMRLRGSIG